MDTGRLPSVWLTALVDGILSVTPFLLLTFLLDLIAAALIGGWLLSTKAMRFKGSKLNPLTGLKRMFGLQALMKLNKALVKFVLVAGIGYLVVSSQIGHLLALGHVHRCGNARGCYYYIVGFFLYVLILDGYCCH